MRRATQGLLALSVVVAGVATWVALATEPAAPPAAAPGPTPSAAPRALPTADDLPARKRTRRPARNKTAPPTKDPGALRRAPGENVPLLVDVMHANGHAAPFAEVRVHMFSKRHSATTDATGRARFMINPTKRADAAKNGAWVDVRVPAAPPRKKFKTWDPAEPLRITLAPSGAVVVHLLHERETLATGPQDTFVFVVGNDRFIRKPVDGHCVLQGVRLGESVGFEAGRIGYFEPDDATGPLPGPGTIGETVTHRVALTPEVPLLQVRLLDASGRPLAAGTELETTRIRRSHGRDATGGLTTSRTVRRGGLLHMPFPVDGTIALRVGAKGRTRIVAAATFVPPARTDEKRVVDLGTVRLDPTVLLVAGRILKRAPTAETGWEPVWGSARVESAYEDAFNPTRDDEKDDAAPACFRSPVHVLLAKARANSAGEFEVWGVRRAKTFALIVEGSMSQRMRLDGLLPGRRDVVVKLGGTRRLRGRVVCSTTLPRGLSVVARAGDGAATIMRVKKDGRFAANGILAPVVDLEVRAAGVPTPIVRRPAVATSTHNDAPLVEISLDAARWITLWVTDPAGNPIAGARAETVPPAGADREARRRHRSRTFTTDASGQIRLLEANAPFDVAISARGRLPTRVEGLRANHAIQLQRGITVQLDFGVTEQEMVEVIGWTSVELIRAGATQGMRLPSWTVYTSGSVTVPAGRSIVRIQKSASEPAVDYPIDVTPADEGKTIRVGR